MQREGGGAGPASAQTARGIWRSRRRGEPTVARTRVALKLPKKTKNLKKKKTQSLRCVSGVLFTAPERFCEARDVYGSVGNASQESQKDLFSKVVVFLQKKKKKKHNKKKNNQPPCEPCQGPR